MHVLHTSEHRAELGCGNRRGASEQHLTPGVAIDIVDKPGRRCAIAHIDCNTPLLQRDQHRPIGRSNVGQHLRLYAQLGKGQSSIRDHAPAFVLLRTALDHAVNRRRANDCHRAHLRPHLEQSADRPPRAEL